jgi:hypothetical protein
LHGQGGGQRFHAEDLTALGAFEVGVFVDFAAWAGIEAPGAVFTSNPVRQRLLDQPVQCAIQGYAVEFAVMAEPFGYFEMGKRTLRIEQGSQYASACCGDAATCVADKVLSIHLRISA